MPIGELLSAVSVLSADEEKCSWHSVQIDRVSTPENPVDEPALSLASSWGKLRAVVRQDSGAIAELLFTDPAFSSKGEWLNLICDAFHLHVHWGKVEKLWLAGHHDELHGLYCMDAKGQLVCSFLACEKIAYTPQQLAAKIALMATVIEIEEHLEVINDE